MSTAAPSASDRRLHRRCRVLPAMVLAACALLGAGQAAASDLYTAEVRVDGRQDAERDAAVEAGLERVIGRMVGVYHGLEDHPAGELLDDAQRYLESYRYLRLDDELAVELRYEGDVLLRHLGERDVAVWGEHRAPILLWVGTEIGGRRDLLGFAASGTEGEVLEALHEGAGQRALPLMYPTLDLRDRQAVGFVDIWGGFDEALREASQRYGSTAVVAAGLRKASTGAWRARWTVLAGDDALQYHTGPGDLEGVVEQGLDEVGGALTRRFAVVPGEHDGQQLEIALTDIDAVEDYLGAVRYLEEVTGVEQVDVQRIAGDRVTLRLLLARSPERVAEDLDDAERLWPEALPTTEIGPGGGQLTRSYRWQP
ncbi:MULTISPECIES: DUF2066 domain-containing protein [unclassified Halorhodospira]|uniref:DUF2066 domain-containing protein n=1 Tax=unclassified Halorhodospira TaxID=2626748 RepID=UPI001EE97A80|nr:MULTISPECIES: DUF2066 domain-containing protein [unclassified Halorhodospira]MCG5541408.1 DUF2066 domain-containing protein [Halorhodospira sp. M39old]MCG5546402.1 DUF2066 domain-containing protein [Halorhodospira sp. M38]